MIEQSYVYFSLEDISEKISPASYVISPIMKKLMNMIASHKFAGNFEVCM